MPWGLEGLMGQVQLSAWKQRQVTHRSQHHSHGGGLRRGWPSPIPAPLQGVASPPVYGAPECVLLTLSGSQSVPPTPVSSVLRAMPFLGRSGAGGACQDQRRRAAGPRPPAHRGSAPHCPIRRAGCPLKEAKIISPTSSLWSPWLSAGPDPGLMAAGGSPRGRVRPSQS